MTQKGEEHSGQGKLTMASEQQDLALEAALRQAIRAQYHFRASEQGLLAWDVRRLVRLSRDLPMQAVALGEIAELDQVHWYGHDAARPTVRSVVAHCQLMMAADLAYPILLDSAGQRWPGDGWDAPGRQGVAAGPQPYRGASFCRGSRPRLSGLRPRYPAL